MKGHEKYYTSYIKINIEFPTLKKNVKAFTTMLKGSMGCVNFLLVDRSEGCFRAKEGEHVFIFFVTKLKYRELLSPNLISRLSFIHSGTEN